MDTSVLWKISYGLYAIGVMEGDKPQGCIVNTVFQVNSLNLIGFSMNKNNHTHALLKQGELMAVSIITQETPPLCIGRLGFYTGADVIKYDGLTYEMARGLPVLCGQSNSAGYFIAKIEASYDAKTHSVFFARVEDAKKGCDAPVMTYEYYHNVVKGQAPKNAPTFRG